MIACLMLIQTKVFDMVWGVRYLQDARGIGYAEAVMRQFSGTATGVVNFLHFASSALLYGVGLAFALTFLLKETGPAARRALA